MYIFSVEQPFDEPTLRPGLDQTEVTPGIVGFLMTALMVVGAVIVFRIMVTSLRTVKLRSDTAEDMLVERNQPRLTEEQRVRPVKADLHADRMHRWKEKYPGYLQDDVLEPQAPDSGRDDDTNNDSSANPAGRN